MKSLFLNLDKLMIAFLAGKFVYKNPTVVHVEANGVGYEVNISLNTYGHIQNLTEGKLFIYLQVKEDSHTLYGFFDMAEKEMFIMLISVSGVGAATARMMLSNMLPGEIAKAIIQGNVKLLESVKGIGKKTAERLVLELKDKVGKHPFESSKSFVKDNSFRQDALDALVALGISKSVAEYSVNKVLAEQPTETQLEQVIKKALKAI
jgi:Holliday junction DNA helicase RuvA